MYINNYISQEFYIEWTRETFILLNYIIKCYELNNVNQYENVSDND